MHRRSPCISTWTIPILSLAICAGLPACVTKTAKNRPVNQAIALNPFNSGSEIAYSFEPSDSFNLDRLIMVRDHSGHDRQAVLTGASLIPDEFGDGSLRIDSSEQILTLIGTESLNPTSAITVTAWVKPRSHKKQAYVVSKDRWGNRKAKGYVLRLEFGKPVFNVGTQTGWHHVSGESVPLTQWVHLAGVWDGKLIKLYINGEMAATKTVKHVIEPTPDPISIGNGSFSAARGRAFFGLIDDVAIYHRSMTDKEITAIFERNRERFASIRAKIKKARD